MRKKNIITLGIVSILLLSICGCVEQEEPTGGEVEGKIAFTEIKIADKPTDDFKYVNVTFSEIRLHKSGNDSGWINFTSEPVTIDLLYLHLNNLTETMGAGNITEGNYTKLWIVVDNASGVLNETNETIYFDIPSGILKIQQLFKIIEGKNTIIVELDLDSSILKYGGGEKYKLLPVLHTLEHKHGGQSQFKEHDKSKIKNMVGNRKPTIDIIVEGSRGKHVTVDVGENITFNASGTFDIDDDNITFFWDFDDGTSATNMTVTHNYSEKGTYHVTLTVDDGVLEASEKITVTVKQKGGHGQGNS